MKRYLTILLVVGLCLAAAPGWWPPAVQTAWNNAEGAGSQAGTYQANTMGTTWSQMQISKANCDKWWDFYVTEGHCFTCELCDSADISFWFQTYYVDGESDEMDGDWDNTAGANAMDAAEGYMTDADTESKKPEPLWSYVEGCCNAAKLSYEYAYKYTYPGPATGHFKNANDHYSDARGNFNTLDVALGTYYQENHQ